jgi:hypothetical protein
MAENIVSKSFVPSKAGAGPRIQLLPFRNPAPREFDGRAMIDRPTPAAYRQSIPAFPSTEPSIATRRFERKRHIIWFSVAVALHGALFLGLWLTPPLRLKAGYAPDRWVQVVSVAKGAPEPAATAVTQSSQLKVSDENKRTQRSGRHR